MHKNGTQIIATPEELLSLKGNAKAFRAFTKICEDWLKANAYKMSRKSKAEAQEAYAWLLHGLWVAVEKLDQRVQSVGVVFTMAKWEMFRAYQEAYGTASQKTEDASTSVSISFDGMEEDILIPVNDEELGNLDFKDFMENLKSNLNPRDFKVLKDRLEGRSLEEIGIDLGITKQGVAKIYSKILASPKIKQYA